LSLHVQFKYSVCKYFHENKTNLREFD